MGKEVVRQDVVQISFDVDKSPMMTLQDDLNKIKSTIENGLGGNVFQGFADGAKNATNGLKKVREQANSLKTPFDNAKNSNEQLKTSVGETVKETAKLTRFTQTFQATNRAIQDGTDKLTSFKNGVKNIPTAVIDKAKSKFQSMKLTIGTTTGVLKGLTKLKLSNLKTDVMATTKALTGGEKGARGLRNALKNVGKVSVTKISTGLSKVKTNISTGIGKAKSFVTNLKKINLTSLKKIDAQLTGLTRKIGSGLVGATQKAIRSLSMLGMASGAFIGSAVTAYADYEQLVGGVDTLFKNSSKTIQKYANDAYKTAGLSANAYMETVTGFSASLLQSLNGDTVKATKYADMAVIDMSDNANKMGTSMESIQYAYQGFAKQNYTMLDNLKLGYGGTKTEMQRLIKDASKLDKSIDANSMSYSNIIKAIHAVQDNMGITGTTAKEAEHTITGSLSAMKASWSNLLTSFIKGDESFEQCFDNMLSSVTNFGKNLIPAIKNAVTTILNKTGIVGTSIQNVIDKIKKFATNSKAVSVFKGIFDDIKNAIKAVITFASELIGKFIEFVGTESNINAIKRAWDAVSTAIEGIWDIATKTFGWIFDNLNWIAPIVLTLVSAFLAFKTAMLAISVAVGVYNAVQWAMNVALYACPLTWIVIAIAAVIAIIVVCIVYWDEIKAVAVKCWEAIKGAWNKVADWFNTNVIQPVVNFFKGLWDKIVTIFTTVVDWVKKNFVSIIAFIINPFAGVFSYLYNNCEGFRNFVNKIVTAIKNFFANMFYFIAGVAVTIWDSIKAVWNTIANWVNTYIIQPIVNYFTVLWSRIKAIVVGVWNSICAVWGVIATWVNTYIIQPIVAFFVNLWNRIVSIVTGVWNTICMVWGQITAWVNLYIIQPVIMFFTNLWTNITRIVTSVWTGICTIWGQISGWVSTNVIEPIKGFFTGLWTSITETVGNIKKAITGAFQSAYDKVTEIWEGITSFFSNLWDGIKNTVNKLINKGKEAIGVESEVKSKDKKGGAKHAWGGLMTTPHWGQVAEDGAEMIIPLSKEKRSRGLALWKQAGNILGASGQATGEKVAPTYSLNAYTPESSAGSYYSKASNTESNTYAPQFNLTINGTSDDRTLERKIKRWVSDAMEEMFESIGRTNEISLQEV